MFTGHFLKAANPGAMTTDAISTSAFSPTFSRGNGLSYGGNGLTDLARSSLCFTDTVTGT